MVRRAERFRTVESARKLPGVMNENRQVLRADADLLAAKFNSQERHEIRAAIAGDAGGWQCHSFGFGVKVVEDV
jgi:hypothetical protein